MKLHEKEKRQSRADAAFLREIVAKRCKGHCELCGDFAPWILELHHIVPVSHLGDGWPENLVALCPNCHAIAEKLRGSAAEDPRFHDWIRASYGADGYEKFERLMLHRWGNEVA